jgi:hypothetical protein
VLNAHWSGHFNTCAIKSCFTASALRMKITKKNLENRKTKQNSRTCWYIVQRDVALCMSSELGCQVGGRRREYIRDR